MFLKQFCSKIKTSQCDEAIEKSYFEKNTCLPDRQAEGVKDIKQKICDFKFSNP